MKRLIVHLEQDWMMIPLILFALILIAVPQPFEEIIHWAFGFGFLAYAVNNFIRRVFFRHEEISPGDCLVKAILGVVILFMQEHAVTIIGIIWAFLSLEAAGHEVDDILRLHHLSVLNVILVIVSIVLSVLLIIHPEEHIELHIRFVGVEIISTVILSLNNREKAPEEEPAETA